MGFGWRVGVTAEQIDELALHADFNPAKETSTRLESFIERTGGTDTWEVEALPPAYLREQFEAAIMANMNQDIYQENIEQEQDDAQELSEFRSEIADSIGLWCKIWSRPDFARIISSVPV